MWCWQIWSSGLNSVPRFEKKSVTCLLGDRTMAEWLEHSWRPTWPVQAVIIKINYEIIHTMLQEIKNTHIICFGLVYWIPEKKDWQNSNTLSIPVSHTHTFYCTCLSFDKYFILAVSKVNSTIWNLTIR